MEAMRRVAEFSAAAARRSWRAVRLRATQLPPARRETAGRRELALRMCHFLHSPKRIPAPLAHPATPDHVMEEELQSLVETFD
jgi:hypothetical protein